ncbi:16491_t:CDS:2, partial [Cetraspora pellucida]
LTMFKCYPEVVLIDSTYKTNQFGMPLLLISEVDIMSTTFLIASGLLVDKTQDFKALMTESNKEQFEILWGHLQVEYPKTTTNAYLKHLLGHMAFLSELINMLERLYSHQNQPEKQFEKQSEEQFEEQFEKQFEKQFEEQYNLMNRNTDIQDPTNAKTKERLKGTR